MQPNSYKHTTFQYSRSTIITFLFNFKFQMGCANSKGNDPYSNVLDKYGNDKLKQFIVAFAKVQFIESSKNQILAIIQQKIEVLKSSLIVQLEAVKMEIDKKYEKSINRIEQSNPKAIMAAEKMFKGKLEELMGYKDALRRVNEYKQQCKLSLQREQSHTISYLKNFIKQFEDEQRQNIPQLKKFQSLDDEQQQKFIKTAKQKHKSSVQKGLTQVQAVIEDKCNFQNFQPKFQSVISKDKLNELIIFAQKCFMTGEQKVKGASDCKTC